MSALNYNEKKAQKGIAQCLYAGNYLNEADKMNFHQKLNGFEMNNRLNKMAATKTLHVSLNFDPTEKIAEDKLINIATDYMDKIGFGDQPYLVYKHNDAGHPHIHIVSTTIRIDGSRINTHNIGRNQSEAARKEIENVYGLIKAEKQHQLANLSIQPVEIKKIEYGDSETKRSISHVVNAVFNQYKFSSLPEFNAALRQFNVVVDRGKTDGRIFKNRGLVYHILDDKGNKVGVPIKASSINCRPTLDNLDKKFESNSQAKESLKQKVKNVVNAALQNTPGSIGELVALLNQKGIYTALRQNAEGRLYGITFVDNHNKVVFNGSDLGKAYSLAAIQSRLPADGEKNIPNNESKYVNSSERNNKDIVPQKQVEKSTSKNNTNESLLDILISSKVSYEGLSSGLLKKKKKKRKKKPDL